MGIPARIARRIERMTSAKALFVWGLILVMPFLGVRRLWLPDEGRYAECAREMMTSGDWLTPTLDSIPHLSKPPLTYWLSAAAMSVMGKNEFAARFFTGLALAGTAALVVLLAASMGRRRSAFLAGLVFLTSLLPFLAGNVLTTDMELTFWETLAVFLFWRRLELHPGGRGSLIGAYAALGLAFMTKGPVGVLVPLLAFAGACAYLRDAGMLRKIASLPGIAVFVCIATPWYLAVAAIHPGLMSYFLGNEVAERMFTTAHHRNNTFLIYPLVLTLGMAPWTYYQLRAILVRYRWSAVKRRLLAPGDVFLGAWVLLPLIFFCLVKSRLPLYILPLFVPLAIITAGGILPESGGEEAHPEARAPMTRPLILAFCTSLLFAALALGASFFPSRQNIHPLIERIASSPDAGTCPIYTTEKGLFTLNFYTGKQPIFIQDVASFAQVPPPAFLVTKKSFPEDALPAGILLEGSHFKYRLYHRPTK
jgi:4-amino-4-deoxy-L-arabinose transferase-like glycosyltransferase